MYKETNLVKVKEELYRQPLGTCQRVLAKTTPGIMDGFKVTEVRDVLSNRPGTVLSPLLIPYIYLAYRNPGQTSNGSTAVRGARRS